MNGNSQRRNAMLSSAHICSVYYSIKQHNKIFKLNYQQANFLKVHYNAFIRSTDNEPGPVVKYPLKNYKTRRLPHMIF